MDKNSRCLKRIIEACVDPWKDLNQFRDLLHDYFPDDKICRNLLYISAEEGIPQRLYKSGTCEEEKIDFQKQRLMDASGCTEQNADKILNMWIEVYGIKIIPVKLETLAGRPRQSPAVKKKPIKKNQDASIPCGGSGEIFNPPIIDMESPYTKLNHPGRDVCDLLRDIRKRIAEKNGIKYEFEECQHTGPCKGTCPACEAELQYLEVELKKKIDRGEKVFTDGLASAELEEYIKNTEKTADKLM